MSDKEIIKHLRQLPPGELWSLIRGSLKYCGEEMKRIVNATRSEEAFIHEDVMAQQIVSYLVGDIRARIEATERSIEERLARQ